MPKVIGYGPSQYTFHIKGQTIGNALIPVQSGLVLTIVDFGFMGIMMLCWLFLLILYIVRHSLIINATYGIAFSIATLSSFIGSLIYGNMVSCFIYFMLSLYAYYDNFEVAVGEINNNE